MTSQQQYALNVQFGRVSGDNSTFSLQEPHIHNNTSTHDQNPGYFSGDDADADADADADMDIQFNAAAGTTTTTTPAKMNTTTSMSPNTGSPNVCPTCNRTFKRRCDLNRHRRTHTRPFKCQLPNCEYSKRGFPTAQELQRHMDDRHSDKPPTFHCTFKGCKYSSKRESNCKQHMEKTHGWKYDRSRHNNNAARAASNDKVERDEDNEIDLDADADGETESVQTKQKEEEDDDEEAAFKYSMPAFGAVPAPVAASSTLSPTGEDYAMHQQQLLQYQQLQQFNNSLSHASTPMAMMGNEVDFILYPDSQPRQQQQAPQQMMMGNGVTAALAADGSVVYTTADTPAVTAAEAALRAVNASPATDAVSNSFVPWESPLTQQEEISNIIRTETRRFDLQSHRPQQQQQQQQMTSMTPPTRPLGYNQGQRAPAASIYPQAIGYFAPADYHGAQVPLPASVPGSAVASAAAAGDYGAAFSPPTPFMGTPHGFRQQQNTAYTSPRTPLVGVPALFPQAWPALLSTTAAQQQRQQQVFAEQAAAIRKNARAKAEAEAVLALVKTTPFTEESVIVAAGDRGVKRDHDTFERDASNTANDDNANTNDNGNDDDDDGDEDEDEENDGNNRRPPRPPPAGHNNPDNIDDDHMPCPYHLTDPAYFYRDNEERFSPCHTQHRYISTLFRHLGRAAHNLIITENSASSFGVHESGNRPQLQAGLCRRCWTSFTDQAAFKAHVEHGRPCARASRSKREKYSQILRTFCAPRPVTVSTPAPTAAPATPAPAAPIPRAAQPALPPAAPIESNAGHVVPPQVRVHIDQTQATPAASSSACGPATIDPRSPDIKVSPTQQEALARLNIPANLDHNRSAPGPVQGRANLPPQHKQHNSVESATLVDVDFYVSRTEFQGFTQSVTQRLSALEAMVHQIGAGVSSVIVPGTTRAAASSSSTRPPSSLGPGPSRSVISVLQTDTSAHERGSLVREMDRQTILEEDEEDDNASRSHRRRHHYHHSQESRMSGAIGTLDANQMLAGIGEPLRTLSGLSSSSDASSVRHVPPPASVSEDNSRSRQLRQQQLQLQQQQQAQGILAGDLQQRQQLLQQLEQLGQQGEQQQAQGAARQRHQHEEAETLPDTVPETVADSGYGSNDNNKVPHQPTVGTLPVVHEVTANVSFGSLLGLEVKNMDNEDAHDNVDIDDGFQLHSMFDEEERDDFNDTNIMWR
ncbi:hypothetical protein Sste5346_004010 [Sporothrix stenoceras]|uniref:C2H2-type domain-containing protein n=1 Tax=Sporothrix stenoceras TaxID=5173 RepID=A0ABR3ZC38_9PEZI